MTDDISSAYIFMLFIVLDQKKNKLFFNFTYFKKEINKKSIFFFPGENDKSLLNVSNEISHLVACKDFFSKA